MPGSRHVLRVHGEADVVVGVQACDGPVQQVLAGRGKFGRHRFAVTHTGQVLARLLDHGVYAEH